MSPSQIRWNADVLVRLLKQIVARRNAKAQQSLLKAPRMMAQNSTCSGDGSGPGTPIDEVKEIIHLPKFDGRAVRNQQDPKTVELDKGVCDQLHNYGTYHALIKVSALSTQLTEYDRAIPCVRSHCNRLPVSYRGAVP